MDDPRAPRPTPTWDGTLGYRLLKGEITQDEYDAASEALTAAIIAGYRKSSSRAFWHRWTWAYGYAAVTLGIAAVTVSLKGDPFVAVYGPLVVNVVLWLVAFVKGRA